jgi:hypothetical protein
LFLYPKPPPPPPDPPIFPPPPTPIASTDTDVTPVGATHEYVPGVKNVVSTPSEVGVMLFEAALAGPVPIALVAVTVNVYAVLTVKPLTVTVPEPD